MIVFGEDTVKVERYQDRIYFLIKRYGQRERCRDINQKRFSVCPLTLLRLTQGRAVRGEDVGRVLLLKHLPSTE